jgi:hypothetical protein
MENTKLNGNTLNPEQFFILGAAKCGTSSLYTYLNQHPDIFMSDPKEPVFFEKEYNRGTEYYRKTYFYSWNNERLVGDARHRNLYLPYIPARIFKLFPRSKLIVIVRNPVERAFSHYIHRKIRGTEALSFEDAVLEDLERINSGIFIDSPERIEDYVKNLAEDGAGSNLFRTYIDSGYYAEQIERYLQYFDKNQILVVFLDDLKQNPENVFKEIITFLETPSKQYEIDFSPVNMKKNFIYSKIQQILSNRVYLKKMVSSLNNQKLKHKVLKLTNFLDIKIRNNNQTMKPTTRSWLVEHFVKHNEKLEQLTGKDLSHWNLL